MNSSTFESQKQESLKRRWQERRLLAIDEHHHRHRHPSSTSFTANNNPYDLQSFSGGGLVDDLAVSTVVPPVTVVLEGRSICQCISLHKHCSYQSLAKALRQMFVAGGCSGGGATSDHDHVDLSNAVPGHLIAYEDMENDLLLVGDLNWKDFVRVAKRIRILPVKANSRKGRGGT